MENNNLLDISGYIIGTIITLISYLYAKKVDKKSKELSIKLEERNKKIELIDTANKLLSISNQYYYEVINVLNIHREALKNIKKKNILMSGEKSDLLFELEKVIKNNIELIENQIPLVKKYEQNMAIISNLDRITDNHIIELKKSIPNIDKLLNRVKHLAGNLNKFGSK